MDRCAFFSCHGGQKDYFKHGLLVAIKSLRRTNPGLPVAVFYDELSAEEKAALSGCRLVQVDASVFDTGSRGDLTRATYFKFCVEQLDGVGKALYVDSDLVVLDSLEGIFRLDGPIAARIEPYDLAHEFKDPARVQKETGIPEKGPFLNGGIVCFDRRYWMKEGLLKQALEIAHQFGWEQFLNSDQGILNILSHRVGGFTPIPLVYNFCRWPDIACSRVTRSGVNAQGLTAPYVMRGIQQRLAAAGVPPAWTGAPLAKVLHWNGPGKPWQFKDEERKKYYAECYEQFTR
jgi:lipopolysaccharide biosynthesis glycosyltransferase